MNALRSGDYDQGTRFLRTAKGEYDPFGVLCDVSAKLESSHYGYWVLLETTQLRTNPMHGNMSTLRGPASYAYMFGKPDKQGIKHVDSFSSTDPPLQLLVDLGISKEQRQEIWNLSDIQHKSFFEIADWIDANLRSRP